MFRRTFIILALAIGVFALGAALHSTDDAEAQGPPLDLPPQAREVAPNIWFLGTAVHNGAVVEGYAFIHTVEVLPHHRPGHSGGPGGGATPTPTPSPSPTATPDPGAAADCYSMIFADSSNWTGLNERVLFDGRGSGIVGLGVRDFLDWAGVWEAGDAAGEALFGEGMDDAGLSADQTAPDDRNEVYFARLVGPGAGNTIAVTFVWGNSSGVDEFDMVYNTKFRWSDSGASNAMDFGAITAHETGHAVGLGHTPGDAVCSEQTMWPSASYGDVHQRTLEVGDKAGAAALYK